jgi:endonuclease/exonuclease/phosphatase family metal-dependent hydrolase
MNKLIINLILPALLFASCHVNEGLRILSYNIHNATGMDNVTDYKRIAEVINSVDADIVAIQEIDSATKRSNGAFVLGEIAGYTEMELIFNASIPFQDGKYGIGILSKEKPVAIKSLALPGREEARSALIAEFESYVVCCTHFSLNSDDRFLSVSIINEHTKDYKKPVFLAGDLNAEPSSKPMTELKKTWEILNDTAKFTIPVDNPQSCIDYVLVRKTDDIKVINNDIVAEKIASDHFPVYVDVILY